ncbi:Plasmid partitioning protein ParA [Altererythrobacter epoxidivorans]|uniref:Plasmid partitioning protein ParA n=1 Tax=Altererythrobacter epoxidivorans TaxID=361183 RepID=A0A0M4MWU8_9SPHN|nr:Plasmid partitioning protein ParA [Altererythrobacter epoxidivorans]
MRVDIYKHDRSSACALSLYGQMTGESRLPRSAFLRCQS